ncbi:MAG: FtsW/RodA/SpoVE family cell cycle protein [Oscillospiraceae bacterium]|nr:FtsW/RodA/SpoVE family cell cycle protein [Oscillospiraceae bacterium]
MKTVLKWLGGYFRHIDWILVLICLCISAFDIYLLNTLHEIGYVKQDDIMTQLFACIIGVGAALVIGMIDYKRMAKYWFVYAPLAVILQLLLFSPLGIKRDDDLAWLDLGVVTIQPSEILKLAFILSLAWHIAKLGEKMNSLPHFLLLCVHFLIPFGLIMVQGDAGSALVFLFIFICMMFAGGMSWRYIIAGLVSVPAVGFVAWNFVMGEHHRKRFRLIWDEELQLSERLGAYLQQYNAKVAMGSGQLTGLGTHSEAFYTYVPEGYNDFIFAYLGMVFGFIGCMAVVIALAVMCLKILSDASLAIDPLGKLICVGVFSMFTFHCVINIAMVLSVGPVVGIPLPFLSAGGTSLVMSYASLGPVLSVVSHREKKKHMFYEEKE